MTPASLFAALLSGLFCLSALAAEDSMTVTVATNILPGTCNAHIETPSSPNATQVNLGEANYADIIAKTKVQTFYLAFSDCAGLANDQALVQLRPRGKCDGTANNGKGFANALTGPGTAEGVSIEVWTGMAPATGTSTQLGCALPVIQTVNVALGRTTTLLWPLSARLVVAQDKTSGDITSGAFSAPAMFTMTYR